MRRATRAAFFAWSVVAAAGCAAISGLDQIRESACSPDCDASVADDGSGVAKGSADATDTGSTADSWRASDAVASDTSDEARGSDATSDGAAGGDGPAVEASSADASDAPSDVGDASGAPADASQDAASEAEGGCGPTNTTANCGACGISCAFSPSSSVASASCNGTACTYACQSGHLDCNASVGFNQDGCECPTSGSATCCGAACPAPHITGYSTGPSGPDQTFYDCSTSVDQQVALDACAQYSGSASNCDTSTHSNQLCPTQGELVVCNFLSMTQNCVCWAYTGAATGWAYNSGSRVSCSCPFGNVSGEVQYH